MTNPPTSSNTSYDCDHSQRPATTSDSSGEQLANHDLSDKRLPPNVMVYRVADRQQLKVVVNEDQFTPKEMKLFKFFKCLVPACVYTTNVGKTFVKHLANNHQHQRYFCYFCNWETVRTVNQAPDTMEQDQFLDHLMKCHLNRTFQCNKCIFRAYTVDHVHIHQLFQHQESIQEPCRIIKCKSITKNSLGYTDFSYFTSHKVDAIKETSESQMYQCVYCEFVNEDQNHVFLHTAHQHSDWPIMIYQPVEVTQQRNLNLSGVSKEEYVNKLKNLKKENDKENINKKGKEKEKENEKSIQPKKKMPNEKPVVRKELSCLFCNMEVFNNNLAIKIHAKFHKTLERFACYRCFFTDGEDKPFLGSEAEINLHNRTKHKSVVPNDGPICVKFIDKKEEITKLKQKIAIKKLKKKTERERKRKKVINRKKSIEKERREFEVLKKYVKPLQETSSDESDAPPESSESDDAVLDDLNDFIVPDNKIDKFDPSHNYLKRKKKQAGKEGNVPLPALDEYIEENERVQKYRNKRLKSTDKSDEEIFILNESQEERSDHNYDYLMDNSGSEDDSFNHVHECDNNELFKKYRRKFNLKSCYVLMKDRLDDNKDWQDKRVIRKYLIDIYEIDPGKATPEEVQLSSESETIDIESSSSEDESEEESEEEQESRGSKRMSKIFEFAPRNRSTPLKNSKHYIDTSKLDTSFKKHITSKDFSNLSSTTSIIPVFEHESRHNLSVHSNLSTNRYYRKSLKHGKEMNDSGLGQRTIIWDNSHSRRRHDKNKQTLIKSRDDLFKFSFAFNPIISAKGKLPLSSKQKVLAICQQDDFIDFEDVFSKEVLNSMKKIGEGSYGEVFSSVGEKGQEFVIKIVPLDMELRESEMFSQILPEITISATFNQLKNNAVNSTPNFIDLKKVNCVRGLYPRKLLKEWHKYDKEFESENPDPSDYTEEQIFMVLQLVNGGEDLENVQLKSAFDAMSIFIQLTLSLAAAERQFEFEHRDLHWGNVLVRTTTEEQLQYRVNKTIYTVESSKQLVSIIDFSLSRMKKDGFIIFDDLSKYEDLFTGEGDFQFEVYRMMRMTNDGCWADFKPVTNIFWLRYILDKLVTAKEFTKRRTADKFKHNTYLRKLTQLRDSVSDFASVVEFVKSEQFRSLPGVEVEED